MARRTAQAQSEETRAPQAGKDSRVRSTRNRRSSRTSVCTHGTGSLAKLHNKMESVITWGVSRGTSSWFGPLSSHNVSRMSYHARRRAAGFRGKNTGVTTNYAQLFPRRAEPAADLGAMASAEEVLQPYVWRALRDIYIYIYIYIHT